MHWRRRFIVVTVVVVLILAGLGADFWFAFVQNWRPPLTGAERYGVDVSAHQTSCETDDPSPSWEP